MILNVTKKEIQNNPNLIVPIACDEVFREIFGNPKNVVFTEYLISALLDIPYQEVKGKVYFQTRTSNKVNINKKKIEKDVVFGVNIDNNKMIINLEMNYKDLSKYKIIRNTKYISDILASTDKPGKNKKKKNDNDDDKENDKIKEVLQFNFNTTFVDKRNKYLIDRYYFRNEKGKILTKMVQIVNINVAEMSRLWYSKDKKKRRKVSEVILWFGALIMENEKSKLNKLINNAPIDKTVAKDLRKKVIEMNDDELDLGRYYNPEEEKAYWRELEIRDKINKKIERIKKRNYDKGMSQGIIQNKEEIVKRMHDANYDINNISDITGLSNDEINKIISTETKKK